MLHLEVETKRLDGSILHCDSNVVLVWIDHASGKSATLPEVLRAACAVTGK